MFRAIIRLVPLLFLVACSGGSNSVTPSSPHESIQSIATQDAPASEAELEAANQYWANHSIPFNNPAQQTASERESSLENERYYQQHENRRALSSTPRPADNCTQLTAIGASPNDDPCCSQAGTCGSGEPPPPPPSICGGGPCVIASSCPSGATCIWGNAGDGYGPTGGAGRTAGCISQGGCIIAVHPGAPKDGLQCNAGLNDEAIGDTVGIVSGQDRTIVDENALWQADGLPYNWNGGITVNSHIWGWLYKDNAGEYWIQSNTAFQWTHSFEVSIDKWAAGFGVALNAPTNNGPHGPIRGVPKPPQGQNYHQCWAAGNNWG